MPPRTVADLAQALPDSERKELLGRIQKSLSLHQKSEEVVVKSKTPLEQRAHLIQEGIGKLGLVQKLYLWFMKVFSGKNETDAFLELKMTELAKSIETNGMADGQARSVGPEFAAQIYKLFIAVTPVRGFIGSIWSDENDLREAIQYVIEERVPKAKSQLFNFLDIEEIQMLFEMSESKGSIRQELLTRINNYMDSIPPEIFGEIEQSIMPLYHMRALCFFDYHHLFRQFYADTRTLETGSPEFKNSSVERVLEPIENLYYALYTAKKAASLEILPAQLYKFVQTKRINGMAGGQGGDTKAPNTIFEPNTESIPRPAPDTAMLDEGLKQLRKDLKNLHEAVGQCIEQSHITDIIRFFNEDPYYKFLGYVPSINLKDFYIATLRFSLLSQLDKEFTTIRKMIVANIYNDLFAKGAAKFEFFQRYPFGEPRGGLPGFRFITSMEYLLSFLSKTYIGGMRETIRGIIKGLPNRNRDTGSELLFHTSGLENVIEKIKALDMAFSPDSEEGKSFQRMKMSLEKDLAQEKQYRIFVIQRDKDNREILEESIEHVAALSAALDDVLSAAPALLAERYGKIFTMKTPTQFADHLRGIVVRLRKASKLIRYQRALDDEVF